MKIVREYINEVLKMISNKFPFNIKEIFLYDRKIGKKN